MIEMKVTGVNKTILSLRHIGDRVVDKARKTMHRAAKRIQKRAEEYAPVDEGDLQRSIYIESTYVGNNRRLQINLQIRPADAAADPRLGIYSVIMHEGEYQLGPKSAAKDAGRGVVGPRFLTRAANWEEEKLNAAMTAAIKEELGS